MYLREGKRSPSTPRFFITFRMTIILLKGWEKE